MMAGDFQKCLKRLNPKLKVCSFGENSKLAGIYYIDEAGEYQDVCGIDKNYVPEHIEFDEAGHITKGGWRRAVQVILHLKLTTKEKVTKLWPGFFMHRSPLVAPPAAIDKIDQKIRKYSDSAPTRSWKDPDTGKIETGSVLTDDQNLDIAADIQAKDDSFTKEKNQKDRWFLETWKKRGGNITDKPTL